MKKKRNQKIDLGLEVSLCCFLIDTRTERRLAGVSYKFGSTMHQDGTPCTRMAHDWNLIAL